jgi:hypothetical protein
MDSMELIQFARVPPPDREPDAAEPLEGAVERDLDRLDTAVRDCRPAAWDLVVERAAAAFGRVLRRADAPRFVPEPDFADGLDDDFSGAFRPLAGCLVPPFEDLAIVSSLCGTCGISAGGGRRHVQRGYPGMVRLQLPGLCRSSRSDDGRYDGRVHAFEFHCDQGATVGGGGTSMILKGCIHQELSAKRRNQNSTFR